MLIIVSNTNITYIYSRIQEIHKCILHNERFLIVREQRYKCEKGKGSSEFCGTRSISMKSWFQIQLCTGLCMHIHTRIYMYFLPQSTKRAYMQWHPVACHVQIMVSIHYSLLLDPGFLGERTDTRSGSGQVQYEPGIYQREGKCSVRRILVYFKGHRIQSKGTPPGQIQENQSKIINYINRF